MSRALMESLQTDMRSLAKLLQSKGRKGDKVLAHISPKEAALLKKRGGAGTKNPETGLLEFAEEGFGSYDGMDQSQAQAETPTKAPPLDYASMGGAAAPVEAPQAPVSEFNQQPQFTGGGMMPQQGPAPQPSSVNTAGVPTFGTVGGQIGSDVSRAPTVPAAAPESKDPSFLDETKKYLSNPANALRLGMTGATGLLGVYQQRKMADQNQKALAEQKGLAKPYQAQGQQLMAQAQRGELSGASRQAYDTAVQQVQQAQAQRGGVPDPQAAVQLATLYNQLIENQYKYGIQVAQIGDQIQLGAIQNGLKLDQQMAQMTQNFYGSLASTAAGLPPQQTNTPRG